jgi:uncharacterized protein YabN with tetrapyrrole methylase and pyrophosphatase domain
MDPLQKKIDEFQKVNSRIFPREFTKTHMAFLTVQLHSELSELYNEIRSTLGREMSPEKTSSREKLVDEYGDVFGVFLAMGRVMNITPEEALDMVTKKLLQLELNKNANTSTDNS